MSGCGNERNLWIGGAAVLGAAALGFVLGAAPPAGWMQVPPEVISGAHARPLPPPADAPRPGPAERALEQLFYWPAGPGNAR